jgi:hypothetical protein
LVSPDVLDAHAAQHLADDDLDVLVVDAHALEPVDLLDLVDQVLRQLLLALHLAGCRAGWPSRPSGLAGAHAVALVHADVLALGDQVLRGSPTSGVTMTLRLPLVSLPNDTTPSISLMIAWSLGLRASKSSATRGRPPVMSLVLVVVSRGILAMTSPASTSGPRARDVRADRQQVARASAPAAFVVSPVSSSLIEMRGRLSGPRLDDDLARQAGDLVELLLHGDAFDDVAELHGAADLGEDRIVNGSHSASSSPA